MVNPHPWLPKAGKVLSFGWIYNVIKNKTKYKIFPKNWLYIFAFPQIEVKKSFVVFAKVGTFIQQAYLQYYLWILWVQMFFRETYVVTFW